MTRVRKNPLFEIYTENNFLIINNTNYVKDNGKYELESISSLELIRNLSFFNKIIEVIFGFSVPAKSNVLRINLENGFKDIVLTNCDVKKVEYLIYETNQLIINKI